MRRAAVVLLGWGAWLGVLTALQAPFGTRAIESEMLGSAAAACLAAGALVWMLDRRRARVEQAERRLVTDSSLASACLACGLALALIGAGFGLWLILIGAGVSALGAGGLLREGRARRRAVGRGPR